MSITKFGFDFFFLLSDNEFSWKTGINRTVIYQYICPVSLLGLENFS